VSPELHAELVKHPFSAAVIVRRMERREPWGRSVVMMGKIDLSKLKGVLKGFGFLRSYSVLLLPAVITLAGALVMVVALLMGSRFREKVNKESIPMGNQVKSLAGSAIPAGQVDVEKRYQDQHQQDANLIALLLVQSTQRELLSYDVFPRPKDVSAQLFAKFGNEFRQRVEGLIKKVNGHECPSEEELKESRQKGSAAAARMPYGGLLGGGTEADRITEEICQARAKTTTVYGNPEDISGYSFWEQYKYTGMEDGIKDCWFWQLGYWIIEDVFDTVDKLNTGSSSVLDSPVKRLMRAGFVSPDKLLGAKRSQDKPKYAIKPEDQLTEACTARISNQDIDVVQFSIVAVVSNKAILPFMKQLSSAKLHRFSGFNGLDSEKVFKHNQITILESRITPVQPDDKVHQRYRYGQDSVVQVELVCEYIFCKKGYDAVKPDLGPKTAKDGSKKGD